MNNLGRDLIIINQLVSEGVRSEGNKNGLTMSVSLDLHITL